MIHYTSMAAVLNRGPWPTWGRELPRVREKSDNCQGVHEMEGENSNLYSQIL